jgi:hypothetical protein
MVGPVACAEVEEAEDASVPLVSVAAVVPVSPLLTTAVVPVVAGSAGAWLKYHQPPARMMMIAMIVTAHPVVLMVGLVIG